MVVCNFFTFYVLPDRTPRGRKSQNTGFFGPFGLGSCHLEKFRAENRKMQFPGARGTFGGKIRPPQKFLPEIAQLFYILRFRRPDPQGRETAEYCFFRPLWPRQPLGTERDSGPKTEKCNFPELGALFGGKSVCPKIFSQKVHNFFTFCVLAKRTPRGGKWQNTGFLGTLGLAQPLALREILGRTKKNTNSLIETEKRSTNPLQLDPNTQS